MTATKATVYTLCKYCDHFVDENDAGSIADGCVPFLHLEDGEQEFDHAAQPQGQAPLAEWMRRRPDLFHEHPDGKIGPNSAHHSRRGKID
jgi:hypothetical protein